MPEIFKHNIGNCQRILKFDLNSQSDKNIDTSQINKPILDLLKQYFSKKSTFSSFIQGNGSS